MARRRRPFHQDEAGALQVGHQALGRDPRHEGVAAVDPPAAVVAERETQGLGDLVGGGWAQLLEVVRHTPDAIKDF